MMMSGRNYSFILMVIFFSFGRLSHSAPLTTIIPDDETTTEMMSTTETPAPSTAAPPIISLPPLRRNITYVAGPDQLTLLMDKGAFRYGFDTDNQFKVERRWANGTVAGYYGYIGADGVPIRVKYGAVDQLGFSAVQQVVPLTFPPTSSTTSRTTTTMVTTSTQEAITSLPESIGLNNKDAHLDEERNSIYVDADFNSLLNDKPKPKPIKKFTFPKIELESIRRKRRSADAESSSTLNLPEAEPLAAPMTIEESEDRHLILDKDQPGEPAIIYSDPSRRPIIKKTVGIQFRLQKDESS